MKDTDANFRRKVVFQPNMSTNINCTYTYTPSICSVWYLARIIRDSILLRISIISLLDTFRPLYSLGLVLRPMSGISCHEKWKIWKIMTTGSVSTVTPDHGKISLLVSLPHHLTSCSIVRLLNKSSFLCVASYVATFSSASCILQCLALLL